MPKHLSYIAIHNQTVNLEGKPGRGKPLDQMMEHYNCGATISRKTLWSITTQAKETTHDHHNISEKNKRQNQSLNSYSHLIM